MKNVYDNLPCYTGDVSGACSALYELGGMVVIHDPSGCNSTYNTHDEIRWYDQDSLIFLSGLSEKDAILGRDDKLLEEVCGAARTLRPRFVALVSSPVPCLSGTDFPALARQIEKRTGIPAFFVPTNGMGDYLSGAGQALLEIFRRFVPPAAKPRPRTLNILGMTPLDFAAEGSREALLQKLTAKGWEAVSCWAMGDSLDQLSRAGEAQVNLVVSAVGMAAAKAMEARLHIPFVAGIPVGAFAETLFSSLETAAATGKSRIPYVLRTGGAASTVLIGEPVTMGSLAAAISLSRSEKARVLCPLRADGALLGPDDLLVQGEDALREALTGIPHVAADPLYQPVIPENAALYPLPHLAFSGRCCLKTVKNLITLDIGRQTQ